MKPNPLVTLPLLALAAAVAIAGCASNGAQTPPANGGAAEGASRSPAQAAAASANAPSAPAGAEGTPSSESSEHPEPETTRIKIIDFSDSIHAGTIRLTEKLGFFEQEGLTLDILSTSGGAQAAPALLNKDVYFAEIAYSHVFKFKQKNQPLIALAQTMDDLGMFVSYGNEWIEKTGIGAGSTLEEKVLALKGARIGVTSVGSLTDETIRYFLKRFGLDPEQDVLITGVGGNHLLTALEAGSVDVSVGFSHFPEYIEYKGVGQTLIRSRDVPELQHITNIVIAANEEWAAEHPNTVRAFLRAISRTFEYMKSNPENALAAAREAWPEVPPEVLEAAVKNRLEVTPDSLAIPEDGARRNLQWLLDAGSLAEPVGVGVTYDNGYLPE